MATRKSYVKIIEELLTLRQDLANAHADVFLEAFQKAAVAEGHVKLPDYWNTLREYRRIKAKLAGRARKKYSATIRNLLDKARQSALEAVGSYNNPLSPFRSGSYIVLMHLAWTSLLMAVLCNRGKKPYCIDLATGKYERRNDGSYQYLSLADCIEQLKTEMGQPLVENLSFFIGLRNQIEHALMPELDLELFGECQSMLMNFEAVLTNEFGQEYALNESLAFSLQFSRLRSEEKDKAAKLLHSTVKPSIRKYIDKFRSSLSDDILSDMAYSFKVFLIPNIGNNRSKEALPIEWVHYDPNDAEQMENYVKSVALIKDRHIPVANLLMMRAGEVADRVQRTIGRPFTASAQHAKCWKHFRVRPPKGDLQPERCNTTYCVYDKVHKDYVYTEKWVDFLVTELSDEGKYNVIAKCHCAVAIDRLPSKEDDVI
jgi:hypothetical protein